ASVSLGDWIGEMEAQARALKNFRVNAETAAENGLRKGLIAALKEAGPEGARRMEQLANASEGEIGRANRAWKGGQEQIDKYVDATAKVPKEKSTTVKAETAGASAAIGALVGQMNAIPRQITSEIVTNRVTNFVNRMLPGSPLGRANGGPVIGPGTATSDSIPARLSNGEHVWTAREVANAGGHAAMEE